MTQDYVYSMYYRNVKYPEARLKVAPHLKIKHFRESFEMYSHQAPMFSYEILDSFKIDFKQIFVNLPG